MSNVIVRELPADEFDKLATVEPFKSMGVLDPKTSRVVVVEDNGAIVGYWPIWNAVHAEPLWLDEDYRKKPAIARDMLDAVYGILREHKIRTVFAVIGHADIMVNGPLAQKVGFERMSGDLYSMRLPEEV